ncbi:unnamed protein product [Camellia sinensis]
MSIFATIDKLYPPKWGHPCPLNSAQPLLNQHSMSLPQTMLGLTWRKTVDGASKVFLEMHYNRHKRLTNDIA